MLGRRLTGESLGARRPVHDLLGAGGEVTRDEPTDSCRAVSVRSTRSGSRACRGGANSKVMPRSPGVPRYDLTSVVYETQNRKLALTWSTAETIAKARNATK